VPTRKQRRRREKDRRHEWEEVLVYPDGREVPVGDENGGEPGEKAKRPGERRQAQAIQRGGRTIQPPSWRRVLKRGLIFAPLMYITVLLLAPDSATPAQNVAQTAFLLAIFLPFSYVMDATTYRIWKRRLEKSRSGRG
jgi:hypothetical protein